MHIKHLKRQLVILLDVFETRTHFNEMPWKINKLIMYKLTSCILGFSVLSRSQCHSNTILIGTTVAYGWLSLGFVVLLLLPCMGRATRKSRNQAFSSTVFSLLRIANLILKEYGMQKPLNSMLAFRIKQNLFAELSKIKQ